MKLIFLSITFLFFHSACSAGENSFKDETGQSKNRILIASEFDVTSNALTYQLAKTYFLKGFITDKMKDQVTKHLKTKNRMGGIFSTEIYYRHSPDSFFGCKNWSWTIGLKNIDHFHTAFSRDLFEVYFRGNKNYAGKTADFSGFNFLLLKYQQLLVGVSKMVVKDSASFEAGASVGFNAGQQVQHIKATHADLFTEETGSYLNVNANLEMQTSDSSHKNLGSFNGFGVSTDLFFKASLKKKHFFFFAVSNLGFIRWNSRSVEIKADTSFRFEGIDVNDLFSFSDTIKTTVTTDSAVVQNFLTQRKFKTYYLLLPAKFEISYKRPIGHRHLMAGIGVNYVLNADYIPQAHAECDYSWKNNMLTLNVSYGGYTQFGTGIFYQHHFGHGYGLMFGSNYINSLFDLNNSRSQNFVCSLRRNF